MKRQRNLGQKIALFIAILCYLGAAGSVIAALLYESSQPNDPIHASIMATAIFLVGCAMVLHVIARTSLKGLISLKDPEK